MSRQQVTDNFRVNVRDWVAYDDKITKAANAIKRVKEKRDTIATNVLSFMGNHNLQKKEIKIGNSRLQYKTVKKITPLTKTYISKQLTEFLDDEAQAKEAVKMMYDVRKRMELCLTDFFQDEDQAMEAVEYIYNNRVRNEVTSLKRKVQRDPVDIGSGPISEVAQNALQTPEQTESENESL